MEQLPDSALRTQLQAIVRTAGNKTQDVINAVNFWFDQSLEALGEVYKRKLKMISFFVGLLIAVMLNIDTIAVVIHLYRNKEARSAMVEVSMQVANKTGKENFDKCMEMSSDERPKEADCAPLMGLVEIIRGRNETIGFLPLGWGRSTQKTVSPVPWIKAGYWLWASRSIGWLLTALAISLGAPFWFDLLNKIVNVRHGMRRPEVKAGEFQ